MTPITLPIDAVLPPPILRPTQRPTEKGRRQKLWDQGFEVEQMAQEYARGDALDVIAVRWDISQPTARSYIVIGGGTIRPASLAGLRAGNRSGLSFSRAKGTKLDLSNAERQRRANQAKINAATRLKNNKARSNTPEVLAKLRARMTTVRALRHKREDAFADDDYGTE